jgi:hypothetical protein
MVLYNASPDMARDKIRRAKNPYIATGIKHLSEENWRLIRYAVWKYGFPRKIVLKDGDTFLRNWDALRLLTEE